MGAVGVQALHSRITNIIELHKEAEDITKAEVIGVLEIIKLDLYQEIAGEDEDED